jgi:glycine/serine hydroxymethyltransferase
MDFKSDNDYVMLFKNEEGNYKIVAWTTDQTHQIIMDTNIPQGTGATAENGRGEELKIKTDKGRLVLELNELPQYLSLPSGIRMN